MEELIMTEQSTSFSSSEIAAAIAAAAELGDQMSLLEVMEFFSDICLAHPICLLEVLRKSASAAEICVEPAMADIMSLRSSPFGRRMKQIH